ncbi:lasso RiPP family leader peptide-containing protein [Georgenia sp. MJ170]
MYESPRIMKVGSVPELTLALTGHGRDDNIFGFKFGQNPTNPTDPPIGS